MSNPQILFLVFMVVMLAAVIGIRRDKIGFESSAILLWVGLVTLSPICVALDLNRWLPAELLKYVSYEEGSVRPVIGSIGVMLVAVYGMVVAIHIRESITWKMCRSRSQ